jgi:hypothetical protein
VIAVSPSTTSSGRRMRNFMTTLLRPRDRLGKALSSAFLARLHRRLTEAGASLDP